MDLEFLSTDPDTLDPAGPVRAVQPEDDDPEALAGDDAPDELEA